MEILERKGVLTMDEHDTGSFSAVILAGGLGTRLRTSVSDRQKAVAEVNGRPFVDFLLRQLAGAGIADVVMACGYRAESVQKLLAEKWPDLRYSIESEPLGTGGALALALPQINSDFLAVMNGDSFFGLDLSACLAWFRAGNAPAAIALTEVPDTSRYGKVQLDSGRIVSFTEKNTSAGKGWINAGIYLFRTDFLKKTLPTGAFSLEKEYFPRILSAYSLAGFVSSGPFIDIGTPESYHVAQSFLKDLD